MNESSGWSNAMRGLPSDLRLALRSLRRSPGFTVVAIVTLGLGIGANTSAFSLANEVLFRPLPYPDSARIDRIYRVTPQSSRGSVAPADYLELKAQSKAYGDIAGYAVAEMSLAAPGQPADVASGLRIAANFFPLLGVAPVLGRGFRADEDVAGNERVIVLSHSYWQKRFAGDPNVVGRIVRVDGVEHEVVGVLSKTLDDWRHLGPFDVFRPLALTAAESSDRTTTWVRLVGRRAAGLTRAEADGFVAAFAGRLASEYPALHGGVTWRTLPLEIAVAPDSGPGVLLMLVGLSVFVLLIACSNLANLLLARTMSRARELAVRSALGASRGRLLRPLFLESLLLAAGGGVCAVYIAAWAGEWFKGMVDYGTMVFAVDWRVMGWAFAACLFTAVVFGVAPAHFALRLDPNRTLKSGGRAMSGDRSHRRFRHALIVGQFALAMILLGGAALFARGVHDLNQHDAGWSADRLVTGTVVLPAARHVTGEQVTAFQRLALEKLEALPGVQSASVSYDMPFLGLNEPRKYVVSGRQVPEPGREPVASTNGVSARYFETTGTRLLAGRSFRDRGEGRVFVINDAMARGLFGDRSALGQRIARAGGGSLEWGEIVGVVRTVESVYPDRVPVAYQVYQPMAQEPRHVFEVAVRSSGPAASDLVEGIRTTLASLDMDLALRRLQPATTSVAQARVEWSVMGDMLSFLAVIGLFLASLGVYGVLARTIAQRTGEFGIRLALGAQVEDIVRLVLASGARLALLGAGLGLAGAIAVCRLIGAFFPGLQTSAAPVLTAVTLLLVGVGLLASYVPARQAARISPNEALRAE